MFEDQEILVGFRANWSVPFGKSVYLTGNIEAFGNWDLSKAHRLKYSNGDTWIIYLRVKASQAIQYKYFLANFDSINPNQITWQNRQSNRTIDVPKKVQEQYFPLTTICSFNIRFLTPKDIGQNHWDNRRDRMCKFINKKQYDVVGVQQATYPQRKYLQDNLKNYIYFGKARDLHKDQQCGIFINNDKFILIEDYYDWISQSRKEGVVGYDAKLPRYFTSILIAPKIVPVNSELVPCIFVINLHLDHIGSISRKKGLQQILQKCIKQRQKIQKSDTYKLIGCIITGDFNIQEGSSELQILTKNNIMNFSSMRQIEGADRSFTFNGFLNKHLLFVGSFLVNNKLTIDHMYYWIAPEARFKPLKFEVDKLQNQKYLSDHYSITGTFGS